MITLYHAGYQVIEKPDVHHGRKNADFGQGFYTTDDRDFACSWVRQQPGSDVIVNKYQLDDSSLKVKTLLRDKEWFEYIFANRRVKPDIYQEYDLIIGPIANDTIYETFGIITSGYLTDEEAMKLLMVGRSSQQIVLKTQKAADKLKFVSSEILSKEQLEEAARKHSEEDNRFQKEFARVMESLE
ncbi:DUF3990 domain-containing protein [Butyrivibrio sp. CB08]|uniref:DUF3990 domain-containing protein n=1 Tax=Butyrivibrio sp. CB08 TaxID=2364879 RepID=UPI000EAA77F1|nr:DUF3990 domain-containing protein [Butyrivibrio sp. CB08]RKM56117.1 DUF3990 domain-containing protein [Butyrivibrio sp. CB08]